MHYSETRVKFIADTGTEIDIVKGVIQVTKVPDFPEREFIACGSAKCSTIRVGDVDVNDLKKRAEELDFAETAGARRNGLPSHCSDSKIIARVNFFCNWCKRFHSGFTRNNPRCQLGFGYPMQAKQTWYNQIQTSWQTTRNRARNPYSQVWSRSFWGRSGQWNGNPITSGRTSFYQRPYSGNYRSGLANYYKQMVKGGTVCLHLGYLRSKTYRTPQTSGNDAKSRAKSLYATVRRYQQQWRATRSRGALNQVRQAVRRLFTLLRSRACTTRSDRCRPFHR